MKLFIVILSTLILISSTATGGVLKTETYDALSDWVCTDAAPSWWTGKSTCTSRSYDGTTHYAGEIDATGRGGTGKSLKQWKAPGTTEGGYDGYLNYRFDATEFANHYRALNARMYVKIDPELNATGCTGECPKFFNRIYGGDAAGQLDSDILFNLNGSTMQNSLFKVSITGGVSPFNSIYSTSSAASYGLFDGEWHCIEVGIVVSDYGEANGEVHVYFDGEEIEIAGGSGQNPSIGQTAVDFNWPANRYITAPFAPGVGNLTVEGVAQWTATDDTWHAIEWDDYVLSTEYIGPAGYSSTNNFSGTTISGGTFR